MKFKALITMLILISLMCSLAFCGSSSEAEKPDSEKGNAVGGPSAGGDANSGDNQNNEAVSKDGINKKVAQSEDLKIEYLPKWVEAAVFINFNKLKEISKVKVALTGKKVIVVNKKEKNIPVQNVEYLIVGVKIPSSMDEFEEYHKKYLKIGIVGIVKTDGTIDQDKELSDILKKSKTKDDANIYEGLIPNLAVASLKDKVIVSSDKKIEECIDNIKNPSVSKSILNNKDIADILKKIKSEYKLAWGFAHITPKLHDAIDELWGLVQMLVSFGGPQISGKLDAYGGLKGIKKIIDEISFIYMGINYKDSKAILDIGIVINEKTSKKLNDLIDAAKKKLTKDKNIPSMIRKQIKEINNSVEGKTLKISIETDINNLSKYFILKKKRGI